MRTARYVRNVLTRWASIRDVVLWNEPNKRLFWNPQTNAPALYEALLARCWDVLHKVVLEREPDRAGPVLDRKRRLGGRPRPARSSVASGMRIASSGRTKRLIDTVGFHPYAAAADERPWRKHIQSKTIGEGDYKLAYNLWLAFNGTAQPAPGTIWYLEAGFQTALDPGKEAWYTGTENVATLPDWAGGEPESPPPTETSPAPDQGAQVLDAIRLAYCQPNVAAFFNFLLMDEPRLSGWQSGAHWADLTAKDSLPAFQSAIAAVNAQSVDSCAKGGLPSPDFMPPSAGRPRGPGRRLAALGRAALGPGLRPEWPGVVPRLPEQRAPRDRLVYGLDRFERRCESAYTYAVRAIDAAVNLGDATSVSVTIDVSPPAAPASLSAQWLGGPSRVELTWPAATDDLGVAAYEVSRDGTARDDAFDGVHGQRDRAVDDLLVLGRRDRRRRQPQRPGLRTGDDAGRRGRTVEALRPDR